MRVKEHYIYKWTNLITNKCYIGKTNNKECRYNWFINWDDHYAGPHIDKARKKYNDLTVDICFSNLTFLSSSVNA